MDRLWRESSVTTVEVCFRYGVPPGENEMRALAGTREVYGIRRLKFDSSARSVRVEYDASRLNEDTVENLLRRAGLDINGKVALA
jgi:hypothetical protein